MGKVKICFRIIAEKKDGKLLSGCSFDNSFFVNKIATIKNVLDEARDRGKVICAEEKVRLRKVEIIKIEEF